MAKTWRLVILGAPGAGKGTQAKRLCEKLDIAHLSTGDILRASLAQGGRLGLEARRYVEAGELVPDGVIVGLIMEKITGKECSGGYLLDGFPRTVAQADALDQMLGELGQTIDRVIMLDVPEASLVERLAGRRICRGCGASFHVLFTPPARDSVCDSCGGELYQRPDDSEETVRNRLRVYDSQTSSLVSRYERAGLLVKIEGNASPEVVFNRMIEKLGEKSL